MTLTTEGLPQLLDSIDAAVDDLKHMEDVHRQAADEVLGHVRPPVRTGRLAASVRAEVDAVGYRVTAGGPEAPYAPIVNARTKFLDTAAEQAEAEVLDIYTDHVEQLLDDIKGA